MKNLNIILGGKISTKISKEGYVYFKFKNHPYATSGGYILEHRLKMEKKIGRYLLPTEIVHHINEIKDDNRIENLQLMTISQHRTHHTSGKKNPMFGKNHSSKVKKSISLKNKGKKLGIKLSLEALAKIRKGVKESWKYRERPFGKKNPMFGKKRTKEEKELISKKTKEGMKKSIKFKAYNKRRNSK